MKPTKYYSGDEWQDLIVQLLIVRYKHDFVSVPAHDRGDLGLDGFSRDGCAYQCYSPIEPLDTPSRYESQRDKITEDLGKLTEYKKGLETLLKNTLIEKWIFVVPIHDSKLINQHAEKKAAEIRKLKLPFLSDKFLINVETLEYFKLEHAQFVKHDLVTLKLPIDQAEEESVSDWASANDPLVKIIDSKLEKVELIPSDLLSKYRNLLLARYLEGTNTLDYLKREYSDVSDRIIRKKQARQKYLVIDNPHSQKKIRDIKSEFLAEILEAVKLLDYETAELIATAAITEWLMECSLHPLGVPNSGA